MAESSGAAKPGGEGASPASKSIAVVSPSAARARKLHIGHFAFMRAVVQGLDLRDSWQRYFRVDGELSDERLVRTTIRWIREEFAAAAQREDRFGTARLVKFDLSKLPDSSLNLPTLEAFAEEHGVEDFSESEQIALYEKEYGRAAQRQARRGRLIERQLDALRWLEALVAQPPRAGDSVAAWLNPVLASHLEAADLFTIAQLVERINGIGHRWHAGIQSMGEAKAQRIVEWLRQHENTIQLQLGAHIEHPRSQLYAHELNAIVQPASDIRPLEKLIVPSDLDGSQGLYRRPQAQCLLKANNDYQAILAWIRSKQGLTPDQKSALQSRRRQRHSGVEEALDWLQTLSHTQRAYRKEAERFLLWAIMAKRKALSSMTHEDCSEYREFLADPQPRSRWCGSRSRERWSPLWRPFEGPLSPSAQRHALTILKNLYAFLVDQNYLMGNPWSSIRASRNQGPKVNAGRSFSVAQWHFIQEQLQQQPDSSATERLSFGLHLLYATGLRLSEVVAAVVDDLQWVEYPADAQDSEPLAGWMLRVIGKGQREREVPVPIEVIAELNEYLKSRGLSPQVHDQGNPGAFLLGKASDTAIRAKNLRADTTFDPRQGIAATTFYDQLKAFFTECADVLKSLGDARGSERLAKASTHWLRHSHASHAIARGMPIEIAQQNLGHASLQTTTVYVTTEAKRRMKAVREFWREGRAAS